IPDPRHSGGTRPVASTVSEVASHLRRNSGFFWSVFLGVAAVNLSVLGTVAWLPAMLIRGSGVAISNAGYISGMMLIAGGLIGMIGFGWVMDRIGGGTPASRMNFCGWSTGLAVLAGAAFPLVGSLWAMAFLFIAFFSAAAGVVSAAPSVLQQLSPGGMRATVASVYVFVINLVGIGFGPSVTAALGDTLFPGGDGIRYAMAIVAPCGYAIGAILFFNAARHAARTPSTAG
ncbi:MAG TPA: MFS transporter, partial [Sphingomicrobium sp.]